MRDSSEMVSQANSGCFKPEANVIEVQLSERFMLHRVNIQDLHWLTCSSRGRYLLRIGNKLPELWNLVILCIPHKARVW